MSRILIWLVIVATPLCMNVFDPPAATAQNSEQRKQLSAIKRDLSKVGSLIRRKQLEEAEKLLNEAEEQFHQVVKDAMLGETDRTVASLKKDLVERQRDLAAKKLADKDVSFINDVGPILKERCFGCHAENPKGGLRLDTFAGLQKGGASNRPLVFPRNPQRSLLTARLNAPADKRMPKDGEMLPPVEIETIAAWIKQGAKFDGDDRNAVIGQKKKPPAVIVKATGDEKVSFTKDIAPFMVNICVRCHGGRNPRSEFSLETFEKLMQGGESGVLVVGGDLEASRLWDLVGKQDPIKMPPGQALITRTNWNNLRTWIEEGAKFDGKDPNLSLRELVPGAEEQEANQLAKLSPQEFVELRKTRNDEIWKRVLPKEEPNSIENDEFVVYGNVSEQRLGTIAEWARDHAASLRKLFNDKDDLLFKGKLTVFVMKDRYSYEEFNHVVHRRRTPREMTGHSQVTADFEDAYVVLQLLDGVSAEADDPTRISLIDHLTGAYLKRSGSSLPDWVMRGTGLAMASSALPKDSYFKTLNTKVSGAFKMLSRPEEVFADGTFSPSDVGPVGFSLVEYLIRGGGGAKFGRFTRTLQSNDGNVSAAMRDVYGADANTMARRYFATLKK